MIDERWVGFRPNSNSVKPVHVANGMFRTLIGRTSNTVELNRFVFLQKDSGVVPTGHELETVYASLSQSQRINPDDISRADLTMLRRLLRKVVSADKGVYLHRDLMESYTAGFARFVSRDRIAQTGGELVGKWLQAIGSPLADCVAEAVEITDDPITTLCTPLFTPDTVLYTPEIDVLQVVFMSHVMSNPATAPWRGLQQAAETLSMHLAAHPNKLVRLRLAVLFACFFLTRHLTTLESYYVSRRTGPPPPFLLDFSAKSSPPIARASAISYAHACQSVSRFYSWAFAAHLRDSGLNPDELRETPLYRAGAPSADIVEMWRLALEEAETSDEPHQLLGQAIYDIMALEADGDPIRYLRQLGVRSGLLWPPENLQPTKRFALHQDMLEMLVRASVEPGSSVDLPTLQERLWERFGIVVGGRPEDERVLVAAGVYQADSGALRDNRDRFTERLDGLDFARLLADGVLTVQLEGPNVH